MKVLLRELVPAPQLAYEYFSAVEATVGNSDIQDKAGAYQTYLSAISGKSNSAARSISAERGGILGLGW
jgi:hypothetical protein